MQLQPQKTWQQVTSMTTVAVTAMAKVTAKVTVSATVAAKAMMAMTGNRSSDGQWQQQ